jgi:hypothetical protein
MGQFLKLFCIFFLAFALEVRVKAGAPFSEKTQKSKCFFLAGCAQTVEKSVSFNNQKSETFQLKAGTLFKAQSERESQLVSGGILVSELQSLYLFEFLHGQAWITFGDALVSVDATSRTTITNLNGEVTLRLRDGSSLAVPVGFEIWVDGITTEGKNLTGTLQPIRLDVRFDQFKIADKKLKEWTESQGNLVSRAAAIYQDSVNREIASVKVQDAAKKAQKEQEQELRKRRKQEILEKAFSR